MGDVCDYNDLERLMRSPEGKEHLEKTRKMVLGRTIKKVTFENEVHYITTTLPLDPGGAFVVFQPSMDVCAIREQFEHVIEREYYVDFPERKPIT